VEPPPVGVPGKVSTFEIASLDPAFYGEACGKRSGHFISLVAGYLFFHFDQCLSVDVSSGSRFLKYTP